MRLFFYASAFHATKKPFCCVRLFATLGVTPSTLLRELENSKVQQTKEPIAIQRLVKERSSGRPESWRRTSVFKTPNYKHLFSGSSDVLSGLSFSVKAAAHPRSCLPGWSAQRPWLLPKQQANLITSGRSGKQIYDSPGVNVSTSLRRQPEHRFAVICPKCN